MPIQKPKEFNYTVEVKAKIIIWRKREISWWRIKKLLDVPYETLMKAINADENFPNNLRSFRSGPVTRYKVSKQTEMAI